MSRQDIGPGAQASLRELAEARAYAGRQLAEVRASSVNPDAVTFDSSPVTVVHSAVFHFYDKVRPYRSGAPELWHNQQLGAFHIPRTQSYSLPRSNGNRRTRTLVGHRSGMIEINGLLEFDDWRNKALEYRGRTSSSTCRVWLPLNVLQAVHDALSDALVEANLAAKVPEKNVDGEPI